MLLSNEPALGQGDKQTDHQSLSILVTNTVLDKYPIYLAGRDVQSISHYQGQEDHREVIELVLLQQTLFAGGYRGPIQLIPSSWNYTQRLNTLKGSRITMLAQTFWLQDLQPLANYLTITEAVIPRGRYETGLYTVSTNKKALAARTLKDVQQLNGVSNSLWTVDWKTLSAMNLKHLYDSSYWGGMIKMVTAGRADFMLAPITNIEASEIEGSGFHLQPIPGVKIILDGSRHWAISKQHRQSAIATIALEEGMRILKSEGRYQKAFSDIGFNNPRARHWTLLNQTLLSAPIKP